MAQATLPETKHTAFDRLRLALSHDDAALCVPSIESFVTDLQYLMAAHERLREALRVAVQLAAIASDWNLDEVEIDGEMREIHDVRAIFKAALSEQEGK